MGAHRRSRVLILQLKISALTRGSKIQVQEKDKKKAPTVGFRKEQMVTKVMGHYLFDFIVLSSSGIVNISKMSYSSQLSYNESTIIIAQFYKD